ncbi:helix-turn-helix domain-containing protein [Streptomyces sp. NPDC005811]|uniref:AraC family transcriptional regulator n=1 Tax=Streptomyces sp. NPDC005811 TaxID=3154565 RepID=UPI0034044D24
MTPRTPSNAVLSAVIEAAPDPMWVIGPDGDVVVVNDAAATVLGHADAGTLIGRPSHEALHHRHPDGSAYPASECPIVRSERDRAARPQHELFLTRTGRAVPVEWTTSDLRTPGYRLLSFRPLLAAATPGGTSILPAAAELRAQVERRFRDPELTPLVLARDNHISLRTLQLILAREQESPAELIRWTRLAHARDLLAHGASVRGAAEASGFLDVDTFARAFRRVYTHSPRAYRRIVSLESRGAV